MVDQWECVWYLKSLKKHLVVDFGHVYISVEGAKPTIEAHLAWLKSMPKLETWQPC